MAYQIITITVLADEDDAQEVIDAHINLACHDASFGAYCEAREPNADDLYAFSDILAELQEA